MPTSLTAIIRLICDLIDGPGHEREKKEVVGRYRCRHCRCQLKNGTLQKLVTKERPCIPHAIAICDKIEKGLEEMGATGKGPTPAIEGSALLWDAALALGMYGRRRGDQGTGAYLNGALACIRRYRELLEEKADE